MLDINYIEENKEKVIKQLNTRNSGDYSDLINEVIELNTQRKETILKVESLKSEKNNLSKQIGILMKDKKASEVEKIKNDVTKMNITIDSLDKELNSINELMNDKLRYIPNLPAADIIVGTSEDDNKEVKVWGKNDLVHEIPHWDIATKLGLVDFELGPKISGSRFVVYTGLGSKLVRAIADILLTKHTNNGYKEMWVPVIINEEAMYGTGQLPKFKEDAYSVGENQFLIPTSEVPLTNIHANEILDLSQMPIKYTAFTQCFRQEAGSAGRDTKGLIRLHQFNKVELVKITNANDSFKELDLMLNDATTILELFNLPYRVVELCTGDIGFSATKTFDIEVWFPEQKKYREISSCSNCGDFQARNMQIRCRDENNKVQLAHTLNGSGVAIDRLIAAILENYWDGEKLELPKVLQPYFDNKTFIK